VYECFCREKNNVSGYKAGSYDNLFNLKATVTARETKGCSDRRLEGKG
jgi:hypothetical protein